MVNAQQKVVVVAVVIFICTDKDVDMRVFGFRHDFNVNITRFPCFMIIIIMEFTRSDGVSRETGLGLGLGLASLPNVKDQIA